MAENGSKKRILVVMPSFPIPETGAEQKDRAEGIRQLVRLGHDICVIAKLKESVDSALLQETERVLGVRVVGVPYRFSNRILTVREKFWKTLGKFRHPLYFDGAAYEYSEPLIQRVLTHELDTFRPNIVWFEYSYLWPLYPQVRRRNIPIITRSINFEPEHFLEEDGRTTFNYLKFIPKLIGEWLTVRWSAVVLAITPKEKHMYERMGARNVQVLPLRGLARFANLPRPEIRDRSPLHAFFMGSSYSVAHNRAALACIVRDIAPYVGKGEFVFHILGTKVPREFEDDFDGVQCVYDGAKYGRELDNFLATMDVALVPSLMSAGQQQKVFEPVMRGIPTITSVRAIAGYALEPDVHYLAAHTAEEFVAMLRHIRDRELRDRVGVSASDRAKMLFGRNVSDAVVIKALAAATKGT